RIAQANSDLSGDFAGIDLRHMHTYLVDMHRAVDGRRGRHGGRGGGMAHAIDQGAHGAIDSLQIGDGSRRLAIDLLEDRGQTAQRRLRLPAGACEVFERTVEPAYTPRLRGSTIGARAVEQP